MRWYVLHLTWRISQLNTELGRCYPIDTLKAILGFCQKHQLHFISDEVFAMCVFDSGSRYAVPFTSILSFNLSEFINPNLVHVFYSFSKVWMPKLHWIATKILTSRSNQPRTQDFAAGGLRVGFLISRNEDLLRACKGILSDIRTTPALLWILTNPLISHRRLHSASSVAVEIGTAILEDESFLSSFFERARQRLALSYQLVTSILDKERIKYVKGG